MGRFYFIIIGTAIIFLFIILSYLYKFYKKCPPGHVMVIYNNRPDSFGNTIKLIYSGGAFIWPIVGSYQLFSLTPFPIELKIQNLLTSDQNKLDIEAKIIAGISTNEIILQHAVERISGLAPEQIQSLALDIISGQIRFAIGNIKANEINQSIEFMKYVSEYIDNEISNIGLTLINMDIKNIKLLIYNNN